MKASAFDYRDPDTVDAAVELLKQCENARPLAGGQSLIPAMRFRTAEPGTLVDLNGIDTLDYLHESDGRLRLGALVRHADVEQSELINDRYGSFADAAPSIADPLIRNRGTVVGSVVQADPKGDWGSVLLAHDGVAELVGPEGRRTLTADTLVPHTSDAKVRDAELLVEVSVPTPTTKEGSAYHKVKRKIGDYAAAGVAARLRIADNRIDTAGLGLTGVDETSVRATTAEAHLEGERPTPDLFERAGELAAAESNPTSDVRGSASYKRRMIGVLTQRALGDALERTGVVTRTRRVAP